MFKVIPHYTESLRPPWLIWDPISKEKKNFWSQAFLCPLVTREVERTDWNMELVLSCLKSFPITANGNREPHWPHSPQWSLSAWERLVLVTSSKCKQLFVMLMIFWEACTTHFPGALWKRLERAVPPTAPRKQLAVSFLLPYCFQPLAYEESSDKCRGEYIMYKLYYASYPDSCRKTQRHTHTFMSVLGLVGARFSFCLDLIKHTQKAMWNAQGSMVVSALKLLKCRPPPPGLLSTKKFYATQHKLVYKIGVQIEHILKPTLKQFFNMC